MLDVKSSVVKLGKFGLSAKYLHPSFPISLQDRLSAREIYPLSVMSSFDRVNDVKFDMQTLNAIHSHNFSIGVEFVISNSVNFVR